MRPPRQKKIRKNLMADVFGKSCIMHFYMEGVETSIRSKLPVVKRGRRMKLLHADLARGKPDFFKAISAFVIKMKRNISSKPK
jgi:hypothetical protein